MRREHSTWHFGKVSRVRRLLPIAASFLLTPSLASAQGNYRGIPAGGRSALMGNTGVALARDGAAPFLNPATVVGIEDARVSFSVHFYSLTLTSFKGFHAPVGDNSGLRAQPLTNVKLTALPATFCIFLNAGSLRNDKEGRRKLAFCVGTSERLNLSISDSKTGTGPDGRDGLHLASIERSYGRVHVGPTFAGEISQRVWLGASAHVVDTNTTSLTIGNNTVFGGTSRTASAFSSSVSASSFDFSAVLGVVYRLDRETTLGLAFAPPTLHLFGGVDAFDHSQESSPDVTLSRSATGKFSAPIPMRVGLGVGTRGPKLTVEANATLFFPTGDAFTSTVDTTTITTRGAGSITSRPSIVTTRGNYVIDSAVGGEYFFSKTLSLLAGAAVDFPATPPLRTAPELGTIGTTRETQLTSSVGIGSYSGGGELLFGFQFGLARGETYVTNNLKSPAELTPISQTAASFLFIIAGSTTFNKILRTIDDLQKTIPKITK